MNEIKNYKITLYKSMYLWQREFLKKILGYDFFADLTAEEIAVYENKRKEERSAKIAAAMPNKKAVIQCDLDGIAIARFESTGEAARQTKAATAKIIAKCCRGERKHAGGFKWKYESK